MAETRRPKVEDVPKIRKIADQYENNDLPESFETAAIYENKGEIIGFGVLRTIEILLYVTGSNRDKVLAIKNLLPIAVGDAKKLDRNNIYVFAENQKFANILEKHFNFRRIDGVPMILDLENREK